MSDKKWSIKYNLNSCRNCKTYERPHRAFGFCEKCAYHKHEGFRTRLIKSQMKYIEKNREKIYARSSEYFKKRYASDPEFREKYLQKGRAKKHKNKKNETKTNKTGLSDNNSTHHTHNLN